MAESRNTYLAQLALEGQTLVAVDAFEPGRPALPVEGRGRPPGTFVQVDSDGDVARLDGNSLAPPSGALSTLVRVAIEEGMDPTFAPDVMAEVEALVSRGDSETPPGTDDAGLTDMMHLPFVTIDNEDSRDLDQALQIEKEGEGFVVRYALADASFYVTPESAIFRESLSRGSSYYFPGWMVPMLPPALSEGLVSLNPKVIRRALVFEMRLSGRGRCLSTHFCQARIKSRAKLSYEGVQRYLDCSEGHEYEGQEFASTLNLLAVVGRKRIADAEQRHVVRYRRRVVELGLADRRSFVIYSGFRNAVEGYNEQISLLCNMEGAKQLSRSRPDVVQAIYRIHPPPPSEKVEHFAALVANLVKEHNLPSETWLWRPESARSLATYLAGLPTLEGEEAGSEEEDAGDKGPSQLVGRIARAIQRQAIVMNARSSFSEDAAIHHGVGAPLYARFSAPMREVVGIFLHKELLEGLNTPATETSSASSIDQDEALRKQIIETANRSRNRQRRITARANHLALDQLFAADLDLPEAARPVRRGTVMGVSQGKLHLSLDEPAIDVKLYRSAVEQASGRMYRLREGGVSMVDDQGTVLAQVGGSLDVRVARRDEKRKRWILLPVG